MKFRANIDDPLVIPTEYKMGLIEEKEHEDVIGKDKEALKKIVLAHLAEDKNYYSKLKSCSMKAEEDYKVPLNKPTKAPLPVYPRFETDLNKKNLKAEEEKAIFPIKVEKDPLKYHTMSKGPKLHVEEPQGVMLTHGGPLHAKSGEKTQTDAQKKDRDAAVKKVYDTALKGEESFDKLGRGKSSLPTPADTAAFNIRKDNIAILAGKPRTPHMPHLTAEEDKAIEVPGTKFPKTREYLKERGLLANEDTCADCGKKLSTSLIEKAEEELGKDKVAESKNKTIVEKFSEEIAKPAIFKAEPAKV
jgi:hypothetical protein